MIRPVARLAGMTSGTAPSDDVRRILLRYRRLAVVGLSPNRSRPSYRAMVHMTAAGYQVTPVNPTCAEVLGAPCVPTLASAAERGPLEIVDVFRRPEEIPPQVHEIALPGAGHMPTWDDPEAVAAALLEGSSR